MSHYSMVEGRSQDKLKFVIFLIPFIIASLISVQVLLKPISFLFADDWLLLDYLIPSQKVHLSQLLQLVNGHNVLTTKLNLILFSHIFGAKTLTAFALFNLVLALTSCILILRKLITKDMHHTFVIATAAFLFFNLKQAQNYNMIISAHFIHSLLCIVIYLSIENTSARKWRWITLIIAPFTGGFGITLLVLEVYVSIRNYFSKKRVIDLFNIFACLLILMLSYGLNFIYGNTINNTPDSGIFSNLSNAIVHPWYLPSFVLSTLGSQFTPSSKYMSAMSQLIGLFVLILLCKVRAQIRKNVELEHLLFIVVTSSLLFTISGYNGTPESIQNAYSNRYVTSTLLIALVLLVSIIKSPRFPYKKMIIAILLISSLLSGVKSGLEWVNLRSRQSETLERLCYSEFVQDKKECLELTFGESFYSDKLAFEKQLQQFLKVHRD